MEETTPTMEARQSRRRSRSPESVAAREDA